MVVRSKVMELGLQDATVLITGGASNIGRGIVHGYAAEGSRIVICDIDGAQAELVRKEALERGASAVEIAVEDLTDPGAAARATQLALDSFGSVDVLVNNAGWSVPAFLAEDKDRARWQRLVEVNFFGAIHATQAVIPTMKEAGRGSIVFVASEAAFGQIRQAVYGGTKAAVVALARTTAKEHGRHGIRANVVCPGLVIPESESAVGDKSLWAVGQENVFDPKQIDFMLKDTPLRRLTTAEDVANAVVWVSSDRAARQVTGQLFSVSGGYTMP
jgi:2-hydroxycyclohexanecarboxyl-CoA dehydrogenase